MKEEKRSKKELGLELKLIGDVDKYKKELKVIEDVGKYIQLDDYDKAVAAYIKLGLKKEEAWKRIGDKEIEESTLGDYDLVVHKYYKRACMKEEEAWKRVGDKIMKGEVGTRYSQHEEYDEAAIAYIKSGMKEEEAWKLAGDAYLKKGVHAKAAEAYAKAKMEPLAKKLWRLAANKRLKNMLKDYCPPHFSDDKIDAIDIIAAISGFSFGKIEEMYINCGMGKEEIYKKLGDACMKKGHHRLAGAYYYNLPGMEAQAIEAWKQGKAYRELAVAYSEKGLEAQAKEAWRLEANRSLENMLDREKKGYESWDEIHEETIVAYVKSGMKEVEAWKIIGDSYFKKEKYTDMARAYIKSGMKEEVAWIQAAESYLEIFAKIGCPDNKRDILMASYCYSHLWDKHMELVPRLFQPRRQGHHCYEGCI